MGIKWIKKAVAFWMFLTIIGGIAFLSCQAWEWYHLYHQGAWWSKNPFPNADGTVANASFTNYFFTITGFHGFHVFSGVLLNIMAFINTLRGTYQKRGHYEMVEKSRIVLAFCRFSLGFLYLPVITCYKNLKNYFLITQN